MKFVRRTWNRYSKLGKRRKKKQVWRKPTGRDNKMREKRKGYPAIVSLGYKTEKKLRGLIDEKMPVTILNIKDLEKLKEKQIAVLGNIGKKKKIEIAKKAKEKKIKFNNFNSQKFLKKIERGNKKAGNKEEKKSPKKESSKTKNKEDKK